MTIDNKPNIGFIGLGGMGFGMARRLVGLGFSVCGYDVNPASGTALIAAGGQVATSAADAAHQADILILMVVSAEQAEDVLFG